MLEKSAPECRSAEMMSALVRAGCSWKSGEARLKFSTRPSGDERLLDFDPRASLVSIKDGSDSVLETVFNSEGDSNNSRIKEITALTPTALAAGSKCKFRNSIHLLASTGADADASAEVEFETEDDCEREFKFEVENLPVGDYDIIVNGVIRGTINVTDTASGMRGELEYSSDTDKTGKLLLNFDPKDKVVKIKQGSTVYFRDRTNNTVMGPVWRMATCHSSPVLQLSYALAIADQAVAPNLYPPNFSHYSWI